MNELGGIPIQSERNPNADIRMARSNLSTEGTSDLETMQSPILNEREGIPFFSYNVQDLKFEIEASPSLSLSDSFLCSITSYNSTKSVYKAAMLPRDYGGFCIQMRLHYSPFAPFLLHLIEWMDYSCTDPLPSFLGLFHILFYKVYVDGKPLVSPSERKATLAEFYAVIYPSLRQLRNGHLESKEETSYCNRIEDQKKLSSEDVERDEECGICMENCRDVVLPNCGHSMCLSCFQDWSARSRSCPFCRNCLKRLSTKDLWVLTSETDVVDSETLAKENLLHFYLYIENMPLFQPDMHIFIPDYML